MRWIIVFLFLYFIPLIVLFKNYNNIKRSLIYASMYTALVTTIVITNMYISGLNKIKEVMYYQNYYFDKEYEKLYKQDTYKNQNQSIDKNLEISNNKSDKLSSEEQANDIVLENNEHENKEVVYDNAKKSDKQIIYEFKKEIYEIELKALIPMRECIPYTKNIVQSLKNLDKIKQDLDYSSDMCREVIVLYETMDIPKLSNDEHTKILSKARNDVKKAYELREKAMESAITLIETKNLKYIGKITEYLNSSDNCIENFKNKLANLNKIVEQ